MPISTDDLKSLIIAKIGDVDTDGDTNPGDNGVIAQNIDLIWSYYSGLPIKLRELYTHRDCIDLVLGVLKDQINTQLGNLQLSKSQRSRTLQQMRDALLTRISKIERVYRMRGAIAPITTQTPVAIDDERTVILTIPFTQTPLT